MLLPGPESLMGSLYGLPIAACLHRHTSAMCHFQVSHHTLLVCSIF
ncbi:unnamed protein product [Staurois parvus]|uniref:Uncharacterized protein n=1 Tax=Staurois parvus TaxID=386267 RepID=A0ABN9AUC3_9NEOB|nr:unnamed protein product [Staurois parvus]